MIGVMDADDAAAQEGVSVGDLMAYSADPRTIKRFYELREAGGVAAAKAISALEAAVNQISNLIEAGNLPPTVLLKAAEVLHRVAGIDEKRKGQKGQEDDGRPRAVVNIHLGPRVTPEDVIHGMAERVTEERQP
jgi:hypothetical protein